MKYITLFGLLALSILGQSQSIVWQKTLGGTGDDEMLSVIPLDSSESLITGYSNSNATGDKNTNSKGSYDYWIVKLNDHHTIDWQKTIGGSDTDYLISSCKSIDGGYILAGQSYSGISADKTTENFGSWDYWIVKLNAVGEIEWQKGYGGIQNEEIAKVIATADSGLFICGNSDSDISGNKTENCFGGYDYWLVKLNSKGDIEWQKTYGGSEYDFATDAEQTPDGGYIISGSSESNISGVKSEECYGISDYWVLKLQANGEIVWQKTYGGTSGDMEAKVDLSEDGYIIAGYSDSHISGLKTEDTRGSVDYWILKTDQSGNIIWQKTIGGDGVDVLTSVNMLSDKRVLLGGYSNSSISGDKLLNNTGMSDFWILYMDENGNILKQEVIGGNEREYLSCINIEEDGYTIGGSSRSGISGQKTEGCQGKTDYWIVEVKETNCETTQSFISEIVCERFVSPGGKIWTESGIYVDTIPNFSGCDSVITINLTVTKLVNTVTKSGQFLLADAINADYQWFDCSNAYTPIEGETNQNFVAQLNGSYAVRITQDGCIDTSTCYTVTEITGTNNNFICDFKLYPNPSSGQVHIDINQVFKSLTVGIRSIDGQLLSRQEFSKTNMLNIELPAEKGTYFIEIETNDAKRAIVKAVRN